MKKILFSLGLSCIVLGSYAQPSIKIPIDAHDFGSISEGTQASYTFEVMNVGNQPLIISNVQPSCGCTTPEWTKDPIQPGQKGKIMATYNSTGRPGVFNKVISISSNAIESSRMLTIKGFVESKETAAKVYTEEEKKLSPIALLDRTSYNFGKLEAGQTIHQKIKITNKGKSNLKFSGIKVGCQCVNYTALKPEAAPGEAIEVELVYSPKGDAEQTDIVILSTNDIVSNSVSVTLQATMVRSLSNGSMLNQGNNPMPFK